MSKSTAKVIQALERVGGFASAQELHAFLKRNKEAIGLTTVYRALQSLVVEGRIDALRKDDGEAIYRLCGDEHHHHLVCRNCGKTVEIEGGAIEKWAVQEGKDHGYRDIHHSAEIFGICSDC